MNLWDFLPPLTPQGKGNIGGKAWSEVKEMFEKPHEMLIPGYLFSKYLSNVIETFELPDFIQLPELAEYSNQGADASFAFYALFTLVFYGAILKTAIDCVKEVSERKITKVFIEKPIKTVFNTNTARSLLLTGIILGASIIAGGDHSCVPILDAENQIKAVELNNTLLQYYVNLFGEPLQFKEFAQYCNIMTRRYNFEIIPITVLASIIIQSFTTIMSQHKDTKRTRHAGDGDFEFDAMNSDDEQVINYH